MLLAWGESIGEWRMSHLHGRPYVSTQTRAFMRRGINHEGSPNDLMYRHSNVGYFEWGRQALIRSELSLEKADVAGLRASLTSMWTRRELSLFPPHGHRQAHRLRYRPEAVDFCVETFGVRACTLVPALR